MSLETMADTSYSGVKPAENSFVSGESFAIKASLEKRIKRDRSEDETPARLMFPPFGVHVPNVPRDAQGFRKQHG
jgi:hypothetical protein